MVRHRPARCDAQRPGQGALTAWLCRTVELDPDTDVIRHYDVTEKLCPLYYVEHPEAWDAFRADVAAEMERQTEVS